MTKPLLRLGAAITLATAPLAAHAQTTPAPAAATTTDADPALWVVKDDDTTLYLFGTVHVLKPGLGWFDEAVRKAFDASDQVVLEMVMPEAAEMGQLIGKAAINPTGPTLTERLPEDTRAAYAEAMAGIGLPANAFDRMDPWFAATMLALIPLQKMGYDPNSGAEMVITKAAKTAGKPIVGLETAEQQIGFFDSLPEDAQITFLTATVEGMSELGQVIEAMVTDWSEGDPDALAATMNEELRESPLVAKVLLADRNARWAEWIDQRMAEPGTVFLAVGAGHLAGPDSVQTYLAKQGLEAERVEY